MSDLTTLALITALCLVIPNGYELNRCDGNLHGLSDASGHDLLAPTYSKIDYAGHGLFFAYSINPADRFLCGPDISVVNAHGQILKTAVPPGCHFDKILWPGRKIIQERSSKVERFDADTVLVFKKDDKFGLCNPDGKILLPAHYGIIGDAPDGICFLSESAIPEPHSPLYTYNCEEQKLRLMPFDCSAGFPRTLFFEGLAAFSSPSKPDMVGYIDQTGQFAIPASFYGCSPFHHGCAFANLEKGCRTPVVINRTGQVISPPGFSIDGFYNDEVAIVQDTTKFPARFGLLNTDMKFVLPLKYELIRPRPLKRDFSEPMSLTSKPFLVGGFEVFEKIGFRPKLFSPLGEEMFSLGAGKYLNPSALWRNLTGKPYTAAASADQMIVELEQERSPRSDDFSGAASSSPSKRPKILVTYCAAGLFEKTISKDDDKFDQHYWLARREYPFFRSEMWDRFVRQYGLIGLTESKLKTLLGKPEYEVDGSLIYGIRSGGCMPQLGTALVIKLKNGTAVGWKYRQWNELTIPGQPAFLRPPHEQ